MSTIGYVFLLATKARHFIHLVPIEGGFLYIKKSSNPHNAGRATRLKVNVEELIHNLIKGFIDPLLNLLHGISLAYKQPLGVEFRDIPQQSLNYGVAYAYLLALGLVRVILILRRVSHHLCPLQLQSMSSRVRVSDKIRVK